jgi:hypothetical protein
MSIVPVTLELANDFVFRLHRHHKPVTGAKFAIGVTVGAELRGVAITGRPVSPWLQQHEPLCAEITRCCTDGASNACSMLYGAARRAARAMGHKPIYTYSLPEEGGASLRAAGFRIDKEDAGGPAELWHNRPGRSVEAAGSDERGGKWRWVG